MKIQTLTLGILILSLFSCEKEPGEGGKNDVEGYVMTQEIDRNTLQIIDEYPAFEENIYIIYGENAYHADDQILSYNGHYFFENLYKGKYTLFVYSDCLDCSGNKEPIFKEFELKERKEEFMVDTIYQTKYVD